MNLQIRVGDNLPVLEPMPSASVDLIYIDPPFNTGRRQTRTTLRTSRDEEQGDRTGFRGRRYRTTEVGRLSFADSYPDCLDFIGPRVEQARRLLKPHGSFFFHIDYREVHYCKVLIDSVFGRGNFMNEIIRAYDSAAATS